MRSQLDVNGTIDFTGASQGHDNETSVDTVSGDKRDAAGVSQQLKPPSSELKALRKAAISHLNKWRDEFLEKLPQFDDEMDKLKSDAAKEGKVVRFVGSIEIGKQEVKVGLEKFDTSHPIAALKGSDNIINFYTKRYGASPLIVQGAGAGGEVTAMGVTGDLLKAIRLLKSN